MRKRPAYSAPMSSVAIIITFETQHSTEASQRQSLLPSLAAVKPAVPELMKAPSVINDEINCCRSVDIFQPILATLVSTLYPYTYDGQY